MPSCAAKGCSNRSLKQIAGVSFHRIPKNAERRSEWLKALGREYWNPGNNSYVCSEHFTSDSFYRTIHQVKLKDDVVPNIFKDSRSTNMNSSLLSKEEIKIEADENTSVIMDKICRICAVSSSYVLDIFDIEEDYKYELVNKIQTHLPIKMTVDDPLPAVICVSCLEAIKSWHEFVVTYLIADQQLKEKLGTVRNEDCLNSEIMKTFTVDDVLHAMTLHWESIFNLKIASLTDNGAEQVSEVPHEDLIEEPDDCYTDLIEEPEQTDTGEFYCKENTSETPKNSFSIPESSTNKLEYVNKVKNVNIHRATGKTLIKNTCYHCKQCRVNFKKSEDAVTHQISVHNVKVVCCTLCNPRKVFNISEETFQQHMLKYHRGNTRNKTSVKKLMKCRKKRTLSTVSKDLQSSNNIPNVTRTKASIITVQVKDNNTKYNALINGKNTNKSDDNISNYRETNDFNNDSVITDNNGKKIVNNCSVFQGDSDSTVLSLGNTCDAETDLNNTLHVKEGVNNDESEVNIPAKKICTVYYCFVCRLPYSNKERYDLHCQRHLLGFICDICNKKLRSKYHIKRHMATHDENRLVKCTECGKSFKSEKLLFRHQNSHTKKTYLCEGCGKLCTTRLAIRYHQVAHSDKLDICEICGKGVKYLTTHRQLHKRPDIPFICKLCGKTFNFRYKLQSHMSLHTDEEVHRCPHCPKTLRSKQKCLQHLLQHKMPQFMCEICKKLFRRKSHLNIHSRIHDPNRGKKCRICKERFSTMEELFIHRKSHAEEEIQKQIIKNRVLLSGPNKDLQCSVCQKRCFSNYTLQNHYRIHTGEKPYKCSYCNSSFRLKVSLKAHENHHTGNKPFKCHVCDKAFYSRTNLTQHQSVHFTELPFTCTVCNRSFSRRTYLVNHIRTHTGERPFACRICARAFKQVGDRKKHEDIHNRKSSPQ